MDRLKSRNDILTKQNQELEQQVKILERQRLREWSDRDIIYSGQESQQLQQLHTSFQNNIY